MQCLLSWLGLQLLGGFKEVSEREMDNLIAALENLWLFVSASCSTA